MKRLAIVLSVVLAGVLGILLLNEYQEEQAKVAQYEAREKEVRPLNVELGKLTPELQTLEREYTATREGIATTSVIFTDMDERIYTECYPLMKKRDYPGILAVSETMFPGTEGCMSVEHFQELIDAGWSICMVWDEEKPLESRLPALTALLEEMGMEPGNVMYFPNGTYSEEYDEELQNYGFTVAVHHGEDERQLVTSEDEDGIWHPGSVGLQGKEPKTRMKEAIAHKAHLIHVVGFHLDEELYQRRMFQSMMDYFYEYTEKNKLMVTNISDARREYRNRASGYEQLEEEYKKQKSVLEEKITSVEAEIKERKTNGEE